jgi:hypothetical protein
MLLPDVEIEVEVGMEIGMEGSKSKGKGSGSGACTGYYRYCCFRGKDGWMVILILTSVSILILVRPPFESDPRVKI